VTEPYETKLWGGFSLYMRYTKLDHELAEGVYDEFVEIWDEAEAVETLRAVGYQGNIESDWPTEWEERMRQYVIERGEWL
jgi:hypothetical protein